MRGNLGHDLNDPSSRDIFDQIKPMHAKTHKREGGADEAGREMPDVFGGRTYVLREIATADPAAGRLTRRCECDHG
jgi:hypothetical protein